MGGGWRQQQQYHHHHHHHHNHQQQQQQQHQCTETEKNGNGSANPQTAGRALRNRRYRRILEESQQTKRLFTPEIKRFLKGWLVRRRKNPYPNRTEKKELAFKTGLTYIQICNWFANWRRKLKNSSRNTEESWGHLIKDYNNKAKGNVEQFSISSDDSIWDETAFTLDCERNSTIAHDCHHLRSETDHSYYSSNNNNNNGEEDEDEELLGPGKNGKRYHEESESNEPKQDAAGGGGSCSSSSWCGDEDSAVVASSPGAEAPLLSKWVESAARYRASARYVPWAAYNLSWSCPRRHQRTSSHRDTTTRHREELDAAEALTCLSAWAPSLKTNV